MQGLDFVGFTPFLQSGRSAPDGRADGMWYGTGVICWICRKAPTIP